MSVGTEFFDIRDPAREPWMLVLEDGLLRGNGTRAVPVVCLMRVRHPIKKWIPRAVFSEYWRPVSQH